MHACMQRDALGARCSAAENASCAARICGATPTLAVCHRRHRFFRLQVSYNVNKPMHLATGGDDMRVKVWDLRRPDMPVKILEGHTHW